MIASGLVAASTGAGIAQEAQAIYCARCGTAVSADEDYAREMRGVVEQHRTQIIDVVNANRASNPRLFGSVARGDAGPTSDIDILVDFDEHASYLDLGRIQVEIEAILGHRVDVVPSRTLKPPIRENIMAETVPI